AELRIDDVEVDVHEDAIGVDAVEVRRHAHAVRFERFALAGAVVPRADLNRARWRDRREVGNRLREIVEAAAGENGEAHAVEKAAVGGVGRVVVAVRVEPEDGETIRAQACGGADCGAAVPGQDAGEVARLGYARGERATQLERGRDFSLEWTRGRDLVRINAELARKT